MTNKFFKNKTIFITGGTGSIGSEVVKNLIPLKPKKIIIFSRDEYKQHVLRYKFTSYPFIEYILGDVRDYNSVFYSTKNVDIIFHCAALKHVPVSEIMPEEFIKTNILGAIHVKQAAHTNKVPLVVSISTDKAVDPLNVMGHTKAIQEKIFISNRHQQWSEKTRFINVRFGNVIGTHGSLFPILYHQILNKQPISITDMSMTRFFMSKQDTIDLIFWAATHGKDGEVIIKKMKSVSLLELVKLFFQVMKLPKDYPIKITGSRVGEKLHEALITDDELFRTREKENFFIISPYKEKVLQENLTPKDTKKMKKDEFLSDTPSNFFTKKELTASIKDFITDIKSNRQFI